MSNTPKSVQQPTAVTHFSNHDLSCEHITTGNFMEFNVAKAMELVPKQSIKIDMRTFARMEPLPVPTYGNAQIHNRAYFVPFRTIMPGWDEFINDTAYVDGGNNFVPVVPSISNLTFVEFLTSSICVGSVGDGVAYDILVINRGNIPQKYVFTSFGRYAYKVLCSLGYRVYFDRGCNIPHSSLPLLSYMKVFFDWYFPSAYVDDDRAMSLRKWLNFPASDEPFFNDNFTSQDLEGIFSELIRVSYDSDYFVSAWDNPVAPNDGSFSHLSLNDITTSREYSEPARVHTTTQGTSVIDNPSDNGVSQYVIDALKSVSDYMRRNQISGARTLDRYLSRWGVKLPSANLKRSLFLGEDISNIQFGDVTSTSSTDGASLGAYAGKGIISTTKRDFVDFTTTEFGYLIIVSTIVPKTSYYQGQDRHTFHLSRFDFYTPEFDNLGVQALATRELFVPIDRYLQEDEDRGFNPNNAVFGFVPRFAEYKRSYSNLTGDLVLGSKNVGKEGYTLMRDVKYYYDAVQTNYQGLVHSQSFVDGNDSVQYNRIFNDTSVNSDKFYIVHYFNIDSRFPGKPLYNSYEFKDEDKADKVTIDINGVRAN